MAELSEAQLIRAEEQLLIDERQILLEKAATLKGVFNQKEYVLNWADTSGDTVYFLRAVVPRAKAYMEYMLRVKVGEMPASTLRFAERSAEIRAAEGPIQAEAEMIPTYQMEQVHLRGIIGQALGSCILEYYDSAPTEPTDDKL